METTYQNKCTILAELWIDYKGDPEFDDFISYNDLGLPLAYAIDAGIVESTPLASNFIIETFDLLLNGLGIEDTGFEHAEDMLIVYREKPEE